MVSMEDVDDDLEEEVASECSRSGKVSNVLIHQEKKGQDEIIIKIFVSFTSPSEAEQTVKALNGRWFGGRVIMAEIYDQAKFDTNDLSQ
jgi:poly(U)-binding-splicing factor PUF60